MLKLLKVISIEYLSKTSIPLDRNQSIHRETTDNSNLYYMIECYITENHFMAEKWLTNGVKHMLGLIYQLTQPKVKRMIYERSVETVFK